MAPNGAIFHFREEDGRARKPPTGSNGKIGKRPAQKLTRIPADIAYQQCRKGT
jgi:hypothetical protein